MIELLNVALLFGEQPIPVGRLLFMQNRIHFEFSANYLAGNYDISPIRLLRKPGVQTFDPSLFEGLPGVFNDSLPDGWGRLLFDRAMRARGINPATLTPLDRLAHVGKHGIGALIYEPEIKLNHRQAAQINLDNIATQAANVLNENNSSILDELVELNGSLTGARPKALIGLDSSKNKIIHGTYALPVNYSAWMVKFANSMDEDDIGAVEYAYSQMAKLAGINMPETYLFTSKRCAGYFATKRFERNVNKRLHAHTACGLLHSDFRTPSLDYSDLLLLTLELTKDMRQVEAMYRLAVFNVCAHNRDDHSKNFSFLMDEAGAWILSPAYDLVFSAGPNGEQSTTVLGEGRNPSIEHLMKLAINANISSAKAKEIIAHCQDALAQWPKLAKNLGVGSDTIKYVATNLQTKKAI